MQPNNITQNFHQFFGFTETKLDPTQVLTLQVSEIIEFAQSTHEPQVKETGIKCPKCENPYPHLHKGDQTASCDDCGAEWEV